MEEWIKIGLIVLGLTAFVGSGIAWYVAYKCPEYEEEEYDRTIYNHDIKDQFEGDTK